MSNDIYQQRYFFEESGPFPDLKDVVYEMPSGNVFIGTTLKLNKDEIKPIIMKGIEIKNTPEQQEFFNKLNESVNSKIITDSSSDEERSNEIKQLGKAYSKIKNHGKTNP